MPSLEETRRRKLEELIKSQQERLLQQSHEQAQIQQQIGQLENAVKQYLTRDALIRYGSIKAAHPEKAIQILVILSQLIQSGKITEIDGNILKKILEQITPKKREIRIHKV